MNKLAKRKKKKKNKLFSLFAFILVVIIVGITAKAAYQSITKAMYPHNYSAYVERYAAEYAIDKTLLYAVIKTESSFDPDSVSSANARGLTQITEDTFDWLLTKTGEDYNFDDLFTPEISIKYGAFFLSILMNEYGVTETAIAAYHAGMGNVSSWLENPAYSPDGAHLSAIPISDTAHYVHKVTKAMETYNTIYD